LPHQSLRPTFVTYIYSQDMLKTKKILIAEDDRLNQVRIRADLMAMGYQFTIVSDGSQAVEAIGSEHYDLILMDLAMPVLDGIDATKHIRNNGHELPIIALTAFAESEFSHLTREAGMNGFIRKPYSRKDLQLTIEAVA